MTSSDKANEDAIFRQFQKCRQLLPDEYLSIHDTKYVANRTAGGTENNIASVLESWMHKKVATSAVTQPEIILEPEADPGFTRGSGLNYEKFMRHEHVNTLDGIEECVRYFFDDVTAERFSLSAKSFSLYSFLIAAPPNRKRSGNFLEKSCKQPNPSL
jgi:hypothetical protein